MRMKEALLYSKLENNSVRCHVCAHNCRINTGSRGICAVRENIGGTLFALNYRKAIAEAVDPIEKKPFFHFFPGSTGLSIATLGCNLRCDNCQNWDISQGSKGGKTISGHDLSPEAIVDHAVARNCQSIAYTYTEPTIFLEYALETMKLARSAGLKNIWVSNGYMSEQTVELIQPYLDAINIDLKFFDDETYLKNCGCHLQPVLDNIVRFKKIGCWVEVTTLVIPGLSDSQSTFDGISKFLAKKAGPETPWHLSRFDPDISYRLTDGVETPVETLEHAIDVGRKNGLRYVYIGNIPGHKSEHTYCPKCGEIAIQRDGYRVTRHDKNGLCPKCKMNINIIQQ